jgi:hypothetical protein
MTLGKRHCVRTVTFRRDGGDRYVEVPGGEAEGEEAGIVHSQLMTHMGRCRKMISVASFVIPAKAGISGRMGVFGGMRPRPG